MERHLQALQLWIIWHLHASTVGAFNLDTDNVLQRSAAPGGLFGFSVALHQQLRPDRRNLLLVGAPRARHQGHANVTGVVYQCDLSVTSGRCEPIHFHSKAFLHSKDVDNQWMGVRVISQGPGQHVMACAHRYRHWMPQSSTHLLTGQCYLLRADLQAGDLERKWRRVVCDYEHLWKRQMDPDFFALCQQGHGAAFAKDNTSLLFGGPGAYQWKGIVRLDVLDPDTDDIDAEDPRETGDIQRLEPDLIPLQISSYLGFSLDSGMALMKKGELTIVSGAPRGGLSGQVAFMKRDPAARKNLIVELVLSGPDLASSFGYDLAVVDLNSDGWDDLVVGAPQFFRKDKDDGGAVYVYINNKGRNWETIVPTRLLGPKESMFGLAVENIGDVNQDGFNDIAVGAPYAGSGRVYLYYGSSGGIHRDHAQILSGKPNSVKQFGYSLSGNLDVDDNEYPDLAVGSLSDSVFVYRARPVIRVSTSFRVTPSEIDIGKQRCHERTCHFAGKACFTYRTRPASFNNRLMVNYTFEADSERRKFGARVDFSGSPRGNLELPGQGQEVCTDVKLRLLRDIKDRLSSIPVSVTVSLMNSGQRRSAGAGLPAVTPIINRYQRRSSVSEIILINQGCGGDNICQSNLQLQYKFCSKTTQNGRDVFKPLAREDGVAVITPSSEDIALEITVTNRNGDDAHLSHSVIVLPDTLKYASIALGEAAESLLTCTTSERKEVIDCELGNVFQRDAEVTFHVVLSTTGIVLNTKEVNITLQLQTASVQNIEPVEAVAKVVFELELQVYGFASPSQVPLGQNVVNGESAMKSAEDIGASVRYEFRIANLGGPLKHLANASLNIKWPKESAVGKWLLYLTHVSSEGVQSVSCSPGNEINPLKDVKGWRHVARKRREVEPEALASGRFPFLPADRKYKTLTCEDGLRCVEIRCPLLGLDSSALVALHARLWNSTLVEEYSSLNYLDIVVVAALELTSSGQNIGFKSKNAETKVKLTVFLERKVELLTKVAWWIIFLTVVALLLLLLLLVFFLWQRGCFHHLQHKEPNQEENVPLQK